MIARPAPTAPESDERPRLWPPLLVVGITGGIASGKSTVAAMFRDMGAVSLNADDIGRKLVNPGEPALSEIVLAFGTSFLLPNGELDRRALGNRVFSSPRDLAVLNRITHPRIAKRLADTLAELVQRPPNPPIVVIEAAVLIEAGWESLVDKIVVVTVQQSTQVSRLIAGPGFDAKQARSRIRSQLSVRERLQHANYQISNSGSLAETRRQAENVWSELVRLTEDRPNTSE